MTITIDRKIVAYNVAEVSGTNSGNNNLPGNQAQDASAEEARSTASVIQMHETLQRPEVLIGSTYKIKVPEHVSPHAMYITINDIVLNEGTEYESRRPFEVFINTKNLDHFQWIVALTVIMSAVFRKGGDITFLVDELRSVFDPRGGYWVKGSYKQSIIAEIGDVIERHLIKIGMLQARELDDAQKELIRQKREELEKRDAQQEISAAGSDGLENNSASRDSEATITTDAKAVQGQSEPIGAVETIQTAGQASTSKVAAQSADDGFPPDAQLCTKCNHRSSIFMDGCLTCLNCGDSKCS